MRFVTLLILVATFVSMRPPAPVSAAKDSDALANAVSQFRFRRYHLMRPDLVAFPGLNRGRAC